MRLIGWKSGLEKQEPLQKEKKVIIIKNNIIIIIRTFPESFSPEKFILGNKFVNFKRSNLLQSRNMCTNHEIPLILNLV